MSNDQLLYATAGAVAVLAAAPIAIALRRLAAAIHTLACGAYNRGRDAGISAALAAIEGAGRIQFHDHPEIAAVLHDLASGMSGMNAKLHHDERIAAKAEDSATGKHP